MKAAFVEAKIPYYENQYMSGMNAFKYVMRSTFKNCHIKIAIANVVQRRRKCSQLVTNNTLIFDDVSNVA